MGGLMKELNGKNVVITGGSYGLGLEISRAFLKEGANVFTIARNKEKLDASIEDLKKDVRSGRTVKGYPGDVGDWSKISAVIEQIASDNGGIDVVVNNAGIYIPDYFEKQDVEIFERTDRTNYLGSVFTTKAALPHLLKHKKSAVVFVSSTVGVTAIYGYSSYGPTKAAVVSIAEYVSRELRDKGIGVSVLYPPDTETPGHAVEMETRPFECNALAASSKTLSAPEVAGLFMAGFKKGKFRIMVDFETKLLYRLNGISPKFVDIYLGRIVKKCQREAR
jgi:3-dehydrosphinganine reductase